MTSNKSTANETIPSPTLPSKSSKMSSLEHTVPHLSIYEESNAPGSWHIELATPAEPAPSSSANSSRSPSSSREPGSAPSTTPTSPRLGSSKPQVSSPDTDVHSWEEDMDLFPEYSWLWPSEQNGTWLASAVSRPSSAISSINGTQIRNAISEVGDVVSDRLTHALDGKDLPAMHDRAISYLTPSVSMPSLRQVSQGIDKVTDRAQEAFARGRRQVGQQRRSQSAAPAPTSPSMKEEETEAKDQFTFASTMSSRAIDALVEQGISTDPLPSQKRLESALTLLFIFATNEGGYDAETLFNTTPIWVEDKKEKAWRLKLDIGLVDVIAVEEDEEDYKEENLMLDVDFALEQ